jgi:hypothetical protein
MKTVAAIRGYYARGDIDTEVIIRHGNDALNSLGDRLYRELVGHIGTAWPVKIEREDCVLEKTGETPWRATYIMHWQPIDRPGEVMDPGSCHDGLAVPPPDAIGNYYGILRLPNDDPNITGLYVADPDTGEHPIITAENRTTAYEVTGWSDLHRQWIYARTKGPQ